MEILVYIQATGKTYDINNPTDLLWFREDLSKEGFFSYAENKHYWGMFTRPAKKEEVESLMNAIKLFELQRGSVVPFRAD